MSSIPQLSETQIRIYWESRIALDKFKLEGRELRGPCPIHQGRRNSFAVNQDTGDWYCHSQCGRGGSIFDYEMETSGCDFKTASEAVYRIVGRPDTKPHIVKEYSYTDEHGAELFQCVRFEPKDFKQRHRRPDREWAWNLNGVRRVLYNLPAVIKAPMVFVVEGEKDADALNVLGLTATTCPMGAGKWRSEYSESLRGKDAILIPDRDGKGIAHMHTVAKSLHGIASSIKWIDLPCRVEDEREH